MLGIATRAKLNRQCSTLVYHRFCATISVLSGNGLRRQKLQFVATSRAHIMRPDASDLLFTPVLSVVSAFEVWYASQMGRKTISQTLSDAGRVMGLRKRGVKERYSPAKASVGKLSIQIATAVRMGRFEEADRLRREHFPELARSRELAAKLAGRDPGQSDAGQ